MEENNHSVQQTLTKKVSAAVKVENDERCSEVGSEVDSDCVLEKRKRKSTKKRKKEYSVATPPTTTKRKINLSALTLKILPMGVCKRQSLSLKEKIDIIERIKGGENQAKIATSLKLNRSTIQSIWSTREKFEAAAAKGLWESKKCRRPNNAELDGLVLSWVEHMTAQGTPANGTQIREHARILAKGLGDEDFTASHGWLDHFKKRNKIFLPKSRRHDRMLLDIKDRERKTVLKEHYRGRGGIEVDVGDDYWNAEAEGEDMDYFDDNDDNLPSPSVKSTTTEQSISTKSLKIKTALANRRASSDWISRTWPRLSEGYTPENIFFADEFGLFYRTTPENYKNVQGLSCSDGEYSSERLGVLFGTNALGTERLKLAIVGSCLYPSSFGESWNHSEQDRLPTEYWFQPKAFITPDILSSWLSRWNAQMEANVVVGGGDVRKVLLVMANSKVHQTVQSLCSTLKCIKIVLPTGLGASVLRYLESDIETELKLSYKKQMLNKLIRKKEYVQDDAAEESGRISVIDASGMLHTAWIGVPQSVIVDSFKRSGLLSKRDEKMPVSVREKKKTGEDRNMVRSLIQECRSAGIKFPKELGFQNYLDLDKNLIAVNMSVGVTKNQNNTEDDEQAMIVPPPTNSILSNLDHLRNWAVANKSGDLSSIHDAISTIQNFCSQNLLFSSNHKSNFSTTHLPPPLNRIYHATSQETHHQQHSYAQQQQHSFSTTTQLSRPSISNQSQVVSAANLFSTIDPKSINITLPNMQNVTSFGGGVAFPPAGSSLSQPNFGNNQVSQQQQQAHYIISNSGLQQQQQHHTGHNSQCFSNH